LELARLRYDAHRAANGPEKKLPVDQAADIFSAVFKARAQSPALPEVYELIADVWADCALAPNAGHLGVVSEGVNLFPRRSSLVYRAAALYLASGLKAEAGNFIDLGLALAGDEAERERFEVLQGRLAEQK
jgi:hypothetical protein